MAGRRAIARIERTSAKPCETLLLSSADHALLDRHCSRYAGVAARQVFDSWASQLPVGIRRDVRFHSVDVRSVSLSGDQPTTTSLPVPLYGVGPVSSWTARGSNERLREGTCRCHP